MSPGDETVRAAIAELRSIRSTDPTASMAVATARATAHTLERHWLGEDPGPVAAGVPDR